MYHSRIEDFNRLLFRAITWGIAGLSLFIILFLFWESRQFMSSAANLLLLFGSIWNPTEGYFGLTPMVLSSLLIAFAAVLIAGPLGILLALVVRYFLPTWARVITIQFQEIFAGLPSVVFGFWGLMVLVPQLAQIHQPGVSFFAAVLVLSFMVLPQMSLLVDASFAGIPQNILLGAYASGLSRTTVATQVVLPLARKSMSTGWLLQLARAIGETMVVMMVCGNIVRYPTNPLEPVRTLSANIALEMAYASGSHRSALFASGLILSLTIGLLFVLIHFYFRPGEIK